MKKTLLSLIFCSLSFSSLAIENLKNKNIENSQVPTQVKLENLNNNQTIINYSSNSKIDNSYLSHYSLRFRNIKPITYNEQIKPSGLKPEDKIISYCFGSECVQLKERTENIGDMIEVRVFKDVAYLYFDQAIKVKEEKEKISGIENIKPVIVKSTQVVAFSKNNLNKIDENNYERTFKIKNIEAIGSEYKFASETEYKFSIHFQ